MILWTMAFVILIDTALICLLLYLVRRNTERYITISEWAEDWFKRLEQKRDAHESQIVNAAARIAEMERKFGEIEKLLPKNGNGEVIRNQVLLQQMNDEMERGIKMEREWNNSVAAILNYSKPITDSEVKTNE